MPNQTLTNEEVATWVYLLRYCRARLKQEETLRSRARTHWVSASNKRRGTR